MKSNSIFRVLCLTFALGPAVELCGADPAPDAGGSRPLPNWGEAGNEAVRNLAGMIRIDTSNGIYLEVFLLLHRLGVPLDRDVIFLAQAGEEGASSVGIGFMVAQHWDKIDCEFALDEGGGIRLRDGRVHYVGVSTTEKVPRGIRLIARGTSGHAGC